MNMLQTAKKRFSLKILTRRIHFKSHRWNEMLDKFSIQTFLDSFNTSHVQVTAYSF